MHWRLRRSSGLTTLSQPKDGDGFVKEVLNLTGGKGAQAVIDFVAEGGSTSTGVKMLRRAGNYYIVGYGENINVPTIDIISTEINFIGNLVGSYNDLAELMVRTPQIPHLSDQRLCCWELLRSWHSSSPWISWCPPRLFCFHYFRVYRYDLEC